MEVISINRIAAEALAAVRAGKTLADGCPWPRESEAWPVFRVFFTTYQDLHCVPSIKGGPQTTNQRRPVTA